MSRRLKLLAVATVALALAGNWGWRLLAKPAPLGEERHLAYLFPEASSFGPKGGDPPHYKAWEDAPRGAKRLLGVAFLTTDLLPDLRGYAGPIYVLVGLRADGTLAGIRVVSHRETPSYASAIDGPDYWSRFAGKPVADAFVPGRDVDAISRATVTSEAVARAVRDAGRLAARGVLGLDVPPPAGDEARVPWARVWLAAAAAAGALVSFLLRRPWLRNAVLVYVLAVLGFWLGDYISLGQMVNLSLGRATPPAARPDWYLLLGFSVAAALLWGNLFCGWLCPFGALQEMLARLRGAFPGQATIPGGDRLRWFYLWATLMVAFGLGVTDAVNYEPFGVAFDRRGGWVHWLFLASVLGGALASFRFWCRYFCPVGVIMQLLSSLGRRRRFSLQRDLLGRQRWGEPGG